MAVTATFTPSTNGKQRVGKQFQVLGEVDPVGTYVTGGFAYTPALFGLSRIDSVSLGDSPNKATEFLVGKVISASSLIKLGWTGGASSSELDEITNGTTTTGFVMGVIVRGA